MSKILLTGATGFVGRNLGSYLLAKNLSVAALDLRKPPVRLIPDDTDCIVHLAGKAHDLKSTSQTNEYYKVNTDLTVKLFDAFLQSNARKFIFISSVKASADQVEGQLTETHIPEPGTDYGKSKRLAEEYIEKQKLPEGKSYHILRPCMIHGPGNKGNLNLLYKLVSKGLPYPLAAFENKRSFLSVENLCYVITEIIRRDDIANGIYHVADDEPLSTNELVQIIALASRKRLRLWRINSGLIRKLARLGDILRLPLTTERLTKLTESYIVDNTKIKNALGTQLPVSAREGIVHTARSFAD